MTGHPVFVRPLCPEDLPRIREMLFDPRVARPLALAAARGAAEYLAPWRAGAPDGPRFLVAVPHAGGDPVGAGRVHSGHLDYFVEPAWWGRAVGTRLARALCRTALAELGLGLLRASVLRENGPSRRILERLGFDQERARVVWAPGGTVRHVVLDYRWRAGVTPAAIELLEPGASR